ncbi:MAG: binding-protein-dependent transport system inner rane component [Ilumatobacteraceae bacterium]|nr:binding-protein-dependent transport system inner rane component [Ilumatobacteraceae bacterium]
MSSEPMSSDPMSSDPALLGAAVVTPLTGGRRSAGKLRSVDWLWADRRSKLASCFLGLVILLAIFAPLVSRYSPAEQSVANILKGPSAKHWLGTDDLGRDIWARLVYGARVSLEASGIAVGVALVIGVPIGLVAGYVGGWLDTILMRIVDTLLAFPAIVLAVGITAALGPGLVNAMVAVGVVFSPSIARISRAQVLSTKERLYVDAAVGFGSPSSRTIVRHIVPNAIQPVIVQATFLLGLALLAEASLSFLGLGVQPPTSSWGIMLRRASQFLTRAPNAIYAPGLAIGLTVLSFNVLGDSLRDALDPVAGTRRRLRRFGLSSRRAPAKPIEPAGPLTSRPG